MRQLLLRVPDELHERLARRAKAEGTSVNALATEVLDVAITETPSSARSTLRARAAAAGFAVSTAQPRPSANSSNSKMYERLAAISLDATELIDEQREPL